MVWGWAGAYLEEASDAQRGHQRPEGARYERAAKGCGETEGEPRKSRRGEAEQQQKQQLAPPLPPLQ